MGIPPKIKKILEAAGLWRYPCLICGGKPTEAEHAVYQTATGRQGMGAKQLNEAWAIIPACHQCNHRPRDKDFHRYAAFCIGKAISQLPERFRAEYSLLADRYFEQVRTDDEWQKRIVGWISRLNSAES